MKTDEGRQKAKPELQGLGIWGKGREIGEKIKGKRVQAGRRERMKSAKGGFRCAQDELVV
jgi:hypothetical protein